MSTTSFSLTYKPISRNVNIQSISPDDITPASTVQPNMTQGDIDDTIISECIRNSANVLEINLDLDTNNIIIPLSRISAFDFESFDRIHNTGFNYFTTEISAPADDIATIIDDSEFADGEDTNNESRTDKSKYDTNNIDLFTVTSDNVFQPNLYSIKPDNTVYVSANVNTHEFISETIEFTVTAPDGQRMVLVSPSLRTLANGYGIVDISFEVGSNILRSGIYKIVGHTNYTNLTQSVNINVI